jgi:alkanesulfonate monooxygenase SsuD/methylene tetrahydromethanopterin reductase-like flavin-dependent oxidoreductase (luciferase family)
MKVGLHAFGFVADDDAAARDTLFAGWYYMFSQMAKERGWTDVSRRQFDAFAAPGGAFLVGSPETVAARILEAGETLGGLSRINFQMSASAGHRTALKRSIELLGSAVAPLVRAAAKPAVA